MQKPSLTIIVSFLAWLVSALFISFLLPSLSKDTSKTETAPQQMVCSGNGVLQPWENPDSTDKTGINQPRPLTDTRTLNYSYISTDGRCNLDFIEDTTGVKEKFLWVIFNDFLVLKGIKKGEYKCFHLPNEQFRWVAGEASFVVLNDFWTEFFVGKYTYDEKWTKITSPDFSSFISNSAYQYYNNFYKDIFIWGRVQEFINASNISAVKLSSKGILLYTDSADKLKAAEVYDDEFKDIKETKDSQAFLDCFNKDTTIQAVLKNMKVTNEWLFKNMDIDYKDTLISIPRFNLNYIYGVIKDGNPEKNTCYRIGV